MTPAVHPDTGERVLLIAGGVMPGLPGDDARAKSAWYLVRHADGRYGTGQVFDPAVVPHALGGLHSAAPSACRRFRKTKAASCTSAASTPPKARTATRRGFTGERCQRRARRNHEVEDYAHPCCPGLGGFDETLRCSSVCVMHSTDG